MTFISSRTSVKNKFISNLNYLQNEILFMSGYLRDNELEDVGIMLHSEHIIYA